MSTLRYNRVRNQKTGPDGKKLCLVCEGKLPGRRSSYCSDECWYRNTPSLMRRLVHRRDKGICALCNADTNNRELGWAWEMDHIVPVIEGGGLCGVDGYRTLCIPCHKKESAALAKRRAQARQDAKRPLLKSA